MRPDSPDPEYGTFSIREDGDRLGGTIVTDTTRAIDPFVMTGETVAFTFRHPEMDVIAVRGTLFGDRCEGEVEGKVSGEFYPFAATRQTEGASSGQ